MYQRALKGKEKAWGSEHRLTLKVVHNLRILYENQGEMEKVKAMQESEDRKINETMKLVFSKL